MHPDKSAAVIGLLDLRPGITPEDFEKALEELDVDKVLDANRTARVADVNDSTTLSRRWQILKDSLRSHSPIIRDGAILGFATLDDPRAASLLGEARNAEQVHELQGLIDQVLRQLGRNR
jgi:hypothetical protein